MEKTWILVSDSSHARILSVDPQGGDLREIGEIEHPKSRSHGRDITTDRPGKGSGSVDKGSYSMGSAEDPKAHEARMFAKEIADKIDSARSRNEFDHLIVVSSAAFLGELRKTLSDASARLVTREVNKNLASFDIAEIQKRLEGELSIHA